MYHGMIVWTRAHGTERRAPYGYTCWRSIWPVKQILNYQIRTDVSQNAIICIRQIKNLCYNYHVSISVVDENINEDASSKQSTCSLLDFFYFSVHWFLESGVQVDTVHVARVIFNYYLTGILVQWAWLTYNVISEVDARLRTGLHRPMKSTFTFMKDDDAGSM